MKTSCLYCILLFLFIKGNSYAQVVGITSDFMMPKGIALMGKTIPLHKGISAGAFFTFPDIPVSVGYRFGFSRYAKSYFQKVENTHRLFENSLYIRYESTSEETAVPFVEAGIGNASFNSVYIRKYKYFLNNHHTLTSRSTKHYFNDNIIYGQLSVGMNFKGEDGVWFTVAIDYLRGGKVKHLNSICNPRQFYNNSQLPYNTASPGINGDKNYLDQSVYEAPFQLLQLRIGITIALEY